MKWYANGFVFVAFSNMGAIMKMKFSRKHGDYHCTEQSATNAIELLSVSLVCLVFGHTTPHHTRLETIRFPLHPNAAYSIEFDIWITVLHTQHHLLLFGLKCAAPNKKQHNVLGGLMWHRITDINCHTSSFIIYALASSVQSVCMHEMFIGNTHCSLINPLRKWSNSLLPQINNNLHTFDSFTRNFGISINFLAVWLYEHWNRSNAFISNIWHIDVHLSTSNTTTILYNILEKINFNLQTLRVYMHFREREKKFTSHTSENHRIQISSKENALELKPF